MNANLTVSVITPSRNRADSFVADAVASVAALRLRAGWRVEHVVCDDGSDPVHADGYARLAERFDFVTVVRHAQPRGVAAARNTALAHARGRFVMDLDDDDMLLQNAAVDRYDALVASGRSWVCGAGITVDEAGRYRVGADLPAVDPAAFADQGTAMMSFLDGAAHAYASTRAYWRDTLDDAGGWDETFPVAEDLEHWLRLTALTGPPAYVAAPTVAWRFKESSLGIDSLRSGLMREQATRARLTWAHRFTALTRR